MEKAFVVQKVATKLFATERSVDAAMSDAAELMAMLMQARQDVRASAVVGDQAAVKLAEAIAAISAARSAVVACHNELADVKLRLGVRTKMAGTDPKFIEQIGQADLREVI
ncbi:MAG: hypothetical protein JWP35_1877 [Caulobacter sp.]|nr:hypothetical protein [Caulobacter sp.]